MYKRLCVSIIVVECMAAASCNEFTVDEKQYRGGDDCEFLYIKSNDIKGKQCDVPTSKNEEYMCSVVIDGAVKEIDYSWNYKWHHCPMKYPKCNVDELGNNYCSDVTEAKCKNNDNMKYEVDANGECVKYECKDNNWVRSETDQCKKGVSCHVLKMDANKAIESECGECKNGESFCEENEQKEGMNRKCTNGTWQEVICTTDGNNRTGCNEEKTGCYSCSKDARRYLNDDNNLCVSEKCVEGDWIKGENCEGNVSCKEENGIKSCGECMNGAMKCGKDSENNEIILKCYTGKWDVMKECGAVSCLEGDELNTPSCGECLNDDVKYDNDDGVCKPYICKNGMWILNIENAVRCVGESSCRYGAGNKFVCGECKNGDRKCEKAPDNEAGYLVECISGNWIKKACIDDNDKKVSCLTNTEENNESIRDNVNGQEMCGRCLNGEQQYQDIEDKGCGVSSCENGKWSDYMIDNNTDKVSCCDEGIGECYNGTVLCMDKDNTGSDGVYYCEKGKWELSELCIDSTCNKDKKHCGECKDGEGFYLEENNICHKYKCDKGEKICEDCGDSEQALKVSCKSEGGKLAPGECLNSEPFCKNDELHQCVMGMDVLLRSCISCKDNLCEGENECIEDSCNNAANLVGIAVKCEDNKPKYETCQNNSCNNNTCGECLNGTNVCGNVPIDLIKCEEEKIVCKNNESTECQQIMDFYQCENGALKCKDPTKCIEDSMFQCVDGQWKRQIECENSSCRSGNACGECRNGSKKCEEDVLYQCTRGMWVGTACGNVSCSLENACGECLDQDKRCIDGVSGGKMQICENGKWIDDSECIQGNSCRDNKTCGNCMNKQMKCDEMSESEKISTISLCVSGEWSPVEKCDNRSCHNEGNGIYSCGECRNNSTRFESYQDYYCYNSVCENGRWKKVEDCGKSCKGNSSDGYKCGDCRNYTITYGDNGSGKLRTCLNGKYEYVECNLCWGTYVKEVYDYYLCNAEFHSWCSDIKEDKISCCMKGNVGYNCFNTKQQCMNGNSCIVAGNAETYCGNCQNFTKKCSDDKSSILTCINGNWGYPEVCPNGCEEDKCKD